MPLAPAYGPERCGLSSGLFCLPCGCKMPWLPRRDGEQTLPPRKTPRLNIYYRFCCFLFLFSYRCFCHVVGTLRQYEEKLPTLANRSMAPVSSMIVRERILPSPGMVCKPRNGLRSLTLLTTVFSILTICLDKKVNTLLAHFTAQLQVFLACQQWANMIFFHPLDFAAAQLASTVSADYAL